MWSESVIPLYMSLRLEWMHLSKALFIECECDGLCHRYLLPATADSLLRYERYPCIQEKSPGGGIDDRSIGAPEAVRRTFPLIE